MKKQFDAVKRSFVRGSAAVAGVVASASAMAAPADFTTLTTSVDFSTVATGIMAVAATVAGVYIVVRGARMVLSFIKG